MKMIMDLLDFIKNFLGTRRKNKQAVESAEPVRKPEPKQFGPFTNARYITLTAGGKNVMRLNTCKVTKADCDRITDKMYDEKYEDEINEGSFLDNYFDRSAACCKSYNVINIWGEHDMGSHDTDQILCRVIDADGNVLDEGLIPLSSESIAGDSISSPARVPQHLLISGYDMEEATMKFECPADIDVSQIRFMPSIPISSGGEWLSPDMIRWDSVIYKGRPLRLVDSEEGDSEDFYYALLDLEDDGGRQAYTLVDECSTDLS